MVKAIGFFRLYGLLLSAYLTKLAFFPHQSLKSSFNLNLKRLTPASHTINLINFPSLQNISGCRKNAAHTWPTFTGCPSLLGHNRRELISYPSRSAVIPHPDVESKYTMASSMLITTSLSGPDSKKSETRLI